MTKVSINSERRDDPKEESDRIINSVTHCIDRGKDRGTCHVFINNSGVCQCGAIDLEKSRMK
jgi:hypothetical protein